MPAEFPDLSGVATKELVEQIGSGSFKASYINWSRTMELLRKHAPGWMVETIFNTEGELLHKAPVGGYLLLRLRHIDGTTTPEVPQAVMDHRNNSIPYEKITSRDITDTHRRGSCLLAAFAFGLGYELWAKMPLESGYQMSEEDVSETPKKTASPKSSAKQEASISISEADFDKLAESMGLTAAAIGHLKTKIKGNYENGVKTLKQKDASFVEELNSKFPVAAEEY